MVAVASPDADVSGVVSRWACVLAEQGGSGILTARLAELDRFGIGHARALRCPGI